MDSSKYVRYTPEQVEALERVYAECPKPTSLKRHQLIRECSILSNIDPKQIKVWFQNRRYKSSFYYRSSEFCMHLFEAIFKNLFLFIFGREIARKFENFPFALNGIVFS